MGKGRIMKGALLLVRCFCLFSWKHRLLQRGWSSWGCSCKAMCPVSGLWRRRAAPMFRPAWNILGDFLSSVVCHLAWSVASVSKSANEITAKSPRLRVVYSGTFDPCVALLQPRLPPLSDSWVLLSLWAAQTEHPHRAVVKVP